MTQDQFQRIHAADTLQTLVELSVNGDTDLTCQLFPRLIVILGGFRDHTVKVEQDTFDGRFLFQRNAEHFTSHRIHLSAHFQRQCLAGEQRNVHLLRLHLHL